MLQDGNNALDGTYLLQELLECLLRNPWSGQENMFIDGRMYLRLQGQGGILCRPLCTFFKLSNTIFSVAMSKQNHILETTNFHHRG